MTLRGTDPESYITEYTLVYEEKKKNQQVVNPTPDGQVVRFQDSDSGGGFRGSGIGGGV